MTEEIKTWEGIVLYTGFSKETINKMVKMSGFPAPEYRRSGKQSHTSHFKKADVDQWMRTHTIVIGLMGGYSVEKQAVQNYCLQTTNRGEVYGNQVSGQTPQISSTNHAP